MRGDWRISARGAALLSGLLLFVGCTLSSNPTASVTPTPTPSPSPPPSPTAASTPASITGIPLPTGEVGISYTASLTANGGPTPYVWSVDSGSLPDGLSLTKDGSISGVPTTPGTFKLTVKATDATNQYTTQGATIKIAAALTATLIPACARACQVEQGCVNVCGIFGSQGGGVGPFSYKLLSGLIPTGNHLSGNGLNIVGTFTSINSYWQFTVQVTDSAGATAIITPTFNVYRHLSFAGGTISCSFLGCSQSFPYQLGNPNGAVTLTVKSWTYPSSCFNGACGGLPAPTVTASNGQVTVTVASPGCANWCNGYSGAVLTVVLTDQSPCGAGNCNTGPIKIIVNVAGG